MPDCLFCRIAAGEIPSDRVKETERVLAFRDINPGAPQHILLIPKEHVASSVADLAVDEPEGARTWAELLAVAQAIAGSGSEFADGWRLVGNVGEDASQSVFHLHLHLLAGRRFSWPPG
ncbi:MAG: histidine triad nucleotide-binding protein [Acidimicrobiia bacterium]